MGLISTLRRGARKWMGEGRTPWLTRPVHGAWRFGVNVAGALASPIVLRRTRAVPAGSDPAAMAQMVAGNHFLGIIHAMQVPSEVRGLVAELETVKPKRLLEVGTAGGGTLFMISRAVDPNALLI